MDAGDTGGTRPFEFSQENIDRLKTKYSTEMKDDASNPIKVCMKLVFEAAVERDPNKKSKLALELSRYLTRSDGVINLFLALIDFDTSSQMNTTHNQRFLAVAKIITLLPKLCVPYHDYCANISKQLYPLLIHPNALYSCLAAIIIKALLESPHARKRQFNENDISVVDVVLGPVLAPFTRADIGNKFRISHTILAVHNLLQNHLPKNLFVEQFANLYYCLVALNDTPSQLKTTLRRCLVELLNDLQPGPACCLLEKTLFHDCATSDKYEMVTEEDEISVQLAAGADDESDSSLTIHRSDPDTIDKVMISVLENCDNDPLVIEYFFHFQAKMWTPLANEEITRRCANLIAPLLCQTVEENPDENKLDLSASIITGGATKAQELISKTLVHYLNFLRAHQQAEYAQDEETNLKEVQGLAESSLSMCLNILQVLATTATEDDMVTIHSKILPTLRQIKTIVEDGDTHARVRGQSVNAALVESLDLLIAALTSGDLTGGRLADQVDDMLASKREHQSIMKDLNDKLVPVRVHAIVRLKQMLIANDEYTIQMIGRLYQMVESSLADQEPYVFLASINLFAEMALRKTNEILPRLIELHARSDLDVQQRINVGEVLARLTKRMNATTPHYATQILNALLESAVHEPQELLRMSSLTNIGIVCAQLGHSLGKYILDILESIRIVLDSTDSVQVKCAAVDLMRTTFEGLDRHSVDSIQLDLKAIYALLKKAKLLAARTLDADLSRQVSLAEQEIGRLARDIMGTSRFQRQDNSGKLGRMCQDITVDISLPDVMGTLKFK